MCTIFIVTLISDLKQFHARTCSCTGYARCDSGCKRMKMHQNENAVGIFIPDRNAATACLSLGQKCFHGMKIPMLEIKNEIKNKIKNEMKKILQVIVPTSQSYIHLLASLSWGSMFIPDKNVYPG